MKSQHIKKMIAPIIITLIMIAYFVGYIALITLIEVAIHLKIIGVIIGLSLIFLCLYVIIQRIKEIRSGDEDDLSNY